MSAKPISKRGADAFVGGTLGAYMRSWIWNNMRMPQAYDPDEAYDPDAAKKPVNLSLNADLVARARAEGLNLSSIAEAAVAAVLARRQRERWNADIAAACAAHERYLEQYGSFAEILREQDPAGGAG